MSFFRSASLLALAIGAAVDAVAQTNRGVFDPRPEAVEDSYSAVIAGMADIRHAWNSTRRGSDSPQTDEFEWRGRLGVSAAATRGQLSFSSDYTLMDRRYSERTDSNDQTVVGRSRLQLGRDNRPIYAIFEHSSQEVQVDPTLPDLPENRDRRNLIAGSLNSAWRLFQGNYLRLYAEYSDIQLRYSWTNEAERTGGGVDYTRLISPLYQAGAGLAVYELDYRYLDSADYDSLRAYVWWQAELRRIDYLIQFGLDRVDLAEGDTEQTPFINGQISYDNGLQLWSLDYDQFITDTSQGSFNSEFFSRNVGQDGRLEDERVDQFERQALGFSWLHRRVLPGATMRLGVGVETENYYRWTIFDTRESFLRLDVDYQMNPSMDVDMFVTYDRVEFPNTTELNAYDQMRVEAGVNFTRLFRRGLLRAYAGSEFRNYSGATTTREDYRSPYVGLSFTYGLYEIASRGRSRQTPSLPRGF